MEPPPPKIPAKPPLITPSASPPPFRQGTLSRRTESVPPMKRRRTTSTPRPATPSSSSASQDPIDILEQRKASTARLLDFWDSLARYTRPLDEDDLVDVLTGEVTRDVGVLRSSSKFEFGSLAAPVVDDATSDEGSDTREDQDDDAYDVDELDAFQDDDLFAGDLDADMPCDLDVGAKIVPLVAPLGPADADDLREFMEAEQKRRELYGSEDEEDDDYEVQEIEGTGDRKHNNLDGPGNFRETHDDKEEVEEVEEVEEEEEEEEPEEDATESSATYPHHSSHTVPLDNGSDDELDNWDTIDDDIVHHATKQDIQNSDDDSDSEIEIIEVSQLSKPSQSHTNGTTPRDTSSKPGSQSKHIQGPPRQLYTPPQSSSSSVPSSTPVDNIRLPTRNVPPSISRPSDIHSSSKKGSTRQTKYKGNDISRSKTVDSTRHDQEMPVRRIDLSKIKENSSPVKTTPKKSGISSSLPSKSVVRTPNLKPFVLLTPRKLTSPQKCPSKLQSHNTQIQNLPIASSTVFKGKGKAKQAEGPMKLHKPVAEAKAQLSPLRRKSVQPAARDSSTDDESDGPVPFSSSPPKPSRSRPSRQTDDETFFYDSQHTPDVPTSRDIEKQQFISPTFSSPPIYRKRKRMPSDISIHSPESKSKEAGQSVGKHLSFPNRHPSPSRIPEDSKAKRSPTKAKSSSRGRQRTPEWESGSESESDDSDASGSGRHRQSRPPANADAQNSYPYSHPHYSAAHHPPPPHGFPPIPDPRAQLIITQAMQQLSALVGATWMPPHQYHDNRVPQTPSHRRSSSRPPVSTPFQTPTHNHHPYPYSYDPNLSHATLPPDSPDVSSPEKSGPSRRKSLVRRSRSRGRRVSFHLQEEEITGLYDTEAGYSSPSDRRASKVNSRQEHADWSKHEDRPNSFKGKSRAHTPYHVGPEPEHDSHSDLDGRSSRTRARTPGPRFESSASRTPSRAANGRHGSVERPELQGSSSRHKRRED